MELTKSFVNHCRKIGVLRDFLCQAIDQVDEKDKEIYNIKYSRDEWAKSCNQKDKEIAELKAENAQLKKKLDKAIAERDGNQVCIDALKQKLENVQASMYADVVDANMENRRLKRALYKVCNNWAVCEMDYWRKCLDHYEDYFNVRTDEDLTEEKCERMIDNWRKVAHNCRAKEEKYK